ncbi:formylmethanofuran dehydrogenase subunit E family protein [Pseudanabaenaceae cyanobacterium LEGE 13415]|nr:formylmethanofuran dehydrogenase subunit E family protein [Pseudanabaenaceae cyanobacterium LEGE 13415]
MIKKFGILACGSLILSSLGSWAIAQQHVHSTQNSQVQTPEQWIELGQRVHGGFGSYIALGIRIGLDAVQQLNANPRDLDVTYYNGKIAGCPCVVDGIMIATVASPGQNSLRVASASSPEGTFGVAEIRHRKTGQGLRYTIPAIAKTQLDQWNQNTTGRQRFDAVMQASSMFTVEAIRENSKKP